MHQGDQTVLSLRPGGGRGGAGGGGGGNSRLFSGSRFDSGAGAAAPSLAFGSFSSDLPFLRPHGGAPPSAVVVFLHLLIWIWILFSVFMNDVFLWICFCFYWFGLFAKKVGSLIDCCAVIYSLS